MSINWARRDFVLLYYDPQYVDVFQRDPSWNVAFNDVGNASSHLPFPRLAVITMNE